MEVRFKRLTQELRKNRADLLVISVESMTTSGKGGNITTQYWFHPLNIYIYETLKALSSKI